MSAATEFKAGFETTAKDFLHGLTVEEAFDLATSPGTTAAYSDGSNAARHALSGFTEFAMKLATHYVGKTAALEMLVELEAKSTMYLH